MRQKSRSYGKGKVLACFMAVVMLVAVPLAGCSQKDQEETEVKDLTITVESSKPEFGDLTLQNSFIGTVSPEDTFSVIPLVSGTVTETNFDVGDTVEAGDVLFRIDDSSARLQLASARLGMASVDLQAASTLGPQQDLNLLSQQAALAQINNQIVTTTQSMDQSKDTKSDYEEQKKDLEEQKSDLDSSIQEYEDNIEDLKELEGKFSSFPSTDPLPDKSFPEVGGTFVQDIKGKQYTFVVTQKSQKNVTVSDSNMVLYVYTYEPTEIGGMTHEEVTQSIQALQSAVATMESAKENLEASISSMDTAISSYDSGIDSAQATLDYLNQSKEITEQSNAVQNSEVLQNTENTMELSKQNAQVAIDSAELALTYYTVTAPISGVIEQKNVEKNGLAASGNPAYVISNKDSMVVNFNVSEDIMKTLAVGSQVTIERNGNYYEGILTEIEDSVDLQSGLFKVKASVMADGGTLANGVSVKISVDTYAASGAMLIPYDAVYYDNGAAYVYVMRDGKAVKTYIETGIFDDEKIVVLSGLTADDDVISTWSPQLADGIAVKISGDQEEQNPENVSPEETATDIDGTQAQEPGADTAGTEAEEQGTAATGSEEASQGTDPVESGITESEEEVE